MNELLLNCVRSQVASTLAEIKRLESSEFPYKHTATCLHETREIVLQHRENLNKVNGSTPADTISYICNQAADCVRDFTVLLGFLLRSTNVRNAFEVYGPLLRLASKLLGTPTRLIISSEWHWSPFTYIGYDHLPETVMIGLPATESSNPFLLPLVGHELGHNAWATRRIGNVFNPVVQKGIVEEIQNRWGDFKQFFADYSVDEIEDNFLAQAIWKPAWLWAIRQCEEYFCDFSGVYLFGEAYLYAFAYILASARKGTRTTFYPNMKVRAKKLEEISSQFGISVPNDYSDWFDDLDGIAPEQLRENMLLEVADKVAEQCVPNLAKEAEQCISSQSVEKGSSQNIDNILERFRLNAPAANAGGLVRILNAAWAVRVDPQQIGRSIDDPHFLPTLSEIVLKSIEIDEIEYRIANKSCS